MLKLLPKLRQLPRQLRLMRALMALLLSLVGIVRRFIKAILEREADGPAGLVYAILVAGLVALSELSQHAEEIKLVLELLGVAPEVAEGFFLVLASTVAFVGLLTRTRPGEEEEEEDPSDQA